jgi:hypothetical protein
MRIRNSRAAFPACLLLLALANCAGGGGGDDDGGGGTIIAEFVAACTSGSTCYTNAVTLQKGISSGDTIEIQAVLNKLNTPIAAASLDVVYNGAVADYLGFTKGPALGTGPSDTYLVTEKTGEVLVSISPAADRTLTTEQVMISLTFRLLKRDTSQMDFQGKDNLNGTALYRSDGSVITLGFSGWSGGLISGS